jgi:hypothetical protein
MKKVVLLVLVFMTSQVLNAQNTLPAKQDNRFYYSFAWGLFKSKNYPNVKSEVVKVIKPEFSATFSTPAIDTTKYRNRSILMGLIQWSEKKRTNNN